jgi:hypothetical protein
VPLHGEPLGVGIADGISREELMGLLSVEAVAVHRGPPYQLDFTLVN